MSADRLISLGLFCCAMISSAQASLQKCARFPWRTMCRDLDVLFESGVPMYAERGREGDLRLLTGSRFTEALLSAETQKEIFFALNSSKIHHFS